MRHHKGQLYGMSQLQALHATESAAATTVLVLSTPAAEWPVGVLSPVTISCLSTTLQGDVICFLPVARSSRPPHGAARTGARHRRHTHRGPPAMSVIDPGLKRSMQKAAANEEKFKKKDEAQRAKQAEIDRKRALNAPQKEKATKKIIATQERKRAREKKEYEGEDLAGDSQMVYSIRKGSGRMCTQAAMRGPTAEWPAAWPTGRSTNRPPTSPTAVCR